jgi:hypothetical protein
VVLEPWARLDTATKRTLRSEVERVEAFVA